MALGGVVHLLDFIYPIGHILETTNADFNPNNWYTWQTWERWGNGKAVVGVDEDDTTFATAEKTGGEKTHTLTTAEMPSHYHSMQYSTSWDGVTSAGWVIGTNSGSRVDKTGAVGGNSAHNNLQPYITAYRWRRTA